MRAQGSGVNQHQAWDYAEEQENHPHPNQGIALTPRADQPEQQQDRYHDAGNGVQQHHSGIKDIRLWERVEVNRGHDKEADQRRQPAIHQSSGG